MMRNWLRGMIALAAAAIGAGLLVAGPAAAAPFKTQNVEAELVSSKAAVAPGESFLVALRLKVRPEWHTYWINPGDSGAPTTLDWALPAGFKADAIQWPVPHRLPVGPLVNYGYDGETLYPIRMTAPKSMPIGAPVKIAAEGQWLVCKDICIFEGGLLTLSVGTASTGADDPAWASKINAAAEATPKAAKLDARLTKSST
ncbi:MAG: thiol:disulfide interchange protein, partial [Alphaproteobacteria bacterium]|nr:thiol:disulfide interchange protein [Alphaproteobacteria bacterium]